MRKRELTQTQRHTRPQSWWRTAAGVTFVGLSVCALLVGYTLLIVSHASPQASSSPPGKSSSYLYYVLKTSTGFVLARAQKGPNAQPLETPQQVASFGDGFGLTTADSIVSLQLAPDGRYLAIDGTRGDGELLWIFDTHKLSLSLEPAHVSGTFLRWLPGTKADFLYRPMFPLGLEPLAGQASWNPGLWIVDAATGAHTNLDLHMPSAFVVDATASPDGQQVLYSTSAGLDAGSAIWSMGRDGSHQQRLLNLPGGAQAVAGQFTWSPDQRTIAYERLADSPTPFLAAGLWIMDSQGSHQRYLAQADGGHGFALSWSPDGKKLAFVARTNPTQSQADQQTRALQSAIEVVNLDNGHTSLVAGPAQTGKQFNTNPAWSADSSQITFAAYDPLNPVVGGSARYWSVRVDTSPTQPALAPLSPQITHVVALA